MQQKKKILVVDDNEDILQTIAYILERAGFAVVTEKYPEKLKDDLIVPPDLILMDVYMQGRDGREICKEIKGDKTTENIPVILLSAAQGVGESAMESGANVFIEKPFAMKHLLKEINSLLT